MSGYRAMALSDISPAERDRVADACFHAALLGHPLFGRLSHRYYETYAGPEHCVLDAVVLREGAPVLFMPLSGAAKRLSYFGEPARVFAVPADSAPEAAAFDALRSLTLARAQGRFAEIWMVEDTRFGGQPVRREDCALAVADLAVPEQVLRAGLRKSYKSLVNWGLRNLEASVIDRDNPDYAGFCEMRDLHRAVAGRSTRSDVTWDLQFEMVVQGEAYAVVGRIGRRLVAASLIIHGERAAYYGVGIYDRALMAAGKPLSHASVFRAMLHARARGLQTFVLGDVTPRADSKLNSIAMFKKGFASRIVPEPRVAIELH